MLQGDAEPVLRGAEVLSALDREKEAEERVEALMKEHQFDHEAAMLLAGLRVERGDSGDRTLDLARRAMRFGGEQDALDLLIRVHEARGEEEAVKRIRERWEAFLESRQGEEAEAA